MKRILDIAARTLSILLYPMLMPTYGMMMTCAVINIPEDTQFTALHLWLILCGSTFFITCLIPLICISFLKRSGVITDLYLKQKEQRRWPYLITIACYIGWYFTFKSILPLSNFIIWTIIGAIAALILVAIINTKWKISAHLCAIGGLTGGMLNGALFYNIMPIVSICGAMTASLLLMYARIYLKAHDDKQVVAGYMLGLVCTALPYIITYA